MASAWGVSWGSAWGNSWGEITPATIPAPPSVGGGGGGYSWPGRRKGKSKQEVLFDSIEKTIRDLVTPKVHIGTDHVIQPDNVIDLRIDQALKRLSDIAKRDQALSIRFALLEQEIRLQAILEDDDEILFFLSN